MAANLSRDWRIVVVQVLRKSWVNVVLKQDGELFASIHWNVEQQRLGTGSGYQQKMLEKIKQVDGLIEWLISELKKIEEVRWRR